MATIKKIKTSEEIENEQQKRQHSDSDPDMIFDQEELDEIKAQHTKFREQQISKKQNNKYWPKFFQIFTNDDKPITTLSPFFLQKAIYGLVGTVKKIQKIFRKEQVPYLLVEVSTHQQSLNIMNVTQLAEVPVVVLEDSKLNSSKGVIRTKELDDMEEEDILEELKPQGVTSVRRMIVQRGGKRIITGTYVLTFGTSELPNRINLGYIIVRVAQFIPNPLRCFKCQKFGHGQSSCRNKQICFRCGHEGHEGKDCTENPQCKNCQGDHMASSKDCPQWKKEKEIVTLKHTKNVSFYEAKVLYSQNNPSIDPTKPSYAKVATKILKSIECQTEITWLTPEPKTYISKPQPATSKSNSISCQTEPIQILDNPTTTNVQSTPSIKSNPSTSKTSTTSEPHIHNSNSTNNSDTSNKTANTTSPDKNSKSNDQKPKQNKLLNKPKKGDDSIKIQNSFDALSEEDMETSENQNNHSGSHRSRSRGKHKVITPISGP